MNCKIVFRVDGSPEMGLGHLVRCIALAHMLKEAFDIIFVCRLIPEKIINELADNNFQLQIISSENNFFYLINPDNIVVLDGYAFDSVYQNQIKAAGCKLVCIDDLHDKEFVADLIINHAPGIIPDHYKARPYTQFALGPEYALLRPVFLEQAKKERKIEKTDKVLICFGGSDHNNLTEHTLKVVKGFSQFNKIMVITGPAYLHLNSLSSLIKSDQRIMHFHAADENYMLSIMQEANLAIVPASGILLEALAARCQVVSGMHIENQKLFYSNFKRTGAFFDAVDFNESDLFKAIEKSLTISYKEQSIIDGNSGYRLLKYFLRLEIIDKIKMRKVRASDRQITFKWANDSKVRAYSFKQHLITEEEHNSWFQTKIQDHSCLYLIAEMNNFIIGSIRFDIKGNEAIISYLIDPEYHGKGFGHLLLVNGIKYILETAKEINLSFQKIVGYVMKNNIPSIKSFERLGFKKCEEYDKFKFEMFIS